MTMIYKNQIHKILHLMLEDKKANKRPPYLIQEVDLTREAKKLMNQSDIRKQLNELYLSDKLIITMGISSSVQNRLIGLKEYGTE